MTCFEILSSMLRRPESNNGTNGANGTERLTRRRTVLRGSWSVVCSEVSVSFYGLTSYEVVAGVSFQSFGVRMPYS